MSEEIKNAVVEGTFLGVEDHGILTYFLHLEGEAWSQGFGGHVCDEHNFLAASIREILKTLKVDSWEKLKGTHVRVQGNDNKIHCIGHIIEDRWYDITKHSKEFRK